LLLSCFPLIALPPLHILSCSFTSSLTYPPSFLPQPPSSIPSPFAHPSYPTSPTLRTVIRRISPNGRNSSRTYDENVWNDLITVTGNEWLPVVVTKRQRREGIQIESIQELSPEPRALFTNQRSPRGGGRIGPPATAKHMIASGNASKYGPHRDDSPPATVHSIQSLSI